MKNEKHRQNLLQLEGLLQGETNFITNMANTSAFLKQQNEYFWVGFYRVIEEELVLGPFQGPVACTRIQKGKGVCGTAWDLGESQLVPDVSQFEGHIACNPNSKSEIVVPLIHEGNYVAVLDVDSDVLNGLEREDVTYLEDVVAIVLKASKL